MDFICHDTRFEFESNWSNNCNIPRNQHSPCMANADANRGEPSTSGLLPWQDIGTDTVHSDLYQRYTLDMRFVPAEYRDKAIELQRLGYTDTETLAELARLTKAGCSGAMEKIEALSGYGDKSYTDCGDLLTLTTENVELSSSQSDQVFSSSQSDAMIGKDGDGFLGATRHVEFSSNHSDAMSKHISQWDEGKLEMGDIIQSEYTQDYKSHIEGLIFESDVKIHLVSQEKVSYQTEPDTKGQNAVHLIRNGLIVLGCLTTGVFLYKKFC